MKKFDEELQKKFDELSDAISERRVMDANSLIEELFRRDDLEDVQKPETRKFISLMRRYDVMMETLYDEQIEDVFEYDRGEWY